MKPLFCVFLSLREFTDVKWTQTSFVIILQRIQEYEKKYPRIKASRAPCGSHGTASPLGHAMVSHGRPATPFASVSTQSVHFYLKSSTNKTPSAESRVGKRKHRNTRDRVFLRRLRWEMPSVMAARIPFGLALGSVAPPHGPSRLRFMRSPKQKKRCV
jgi:hypothetical protein